MRVAVGAFFGAALVPVLWGRHPEVLGNLDFAAIMIREALVGFLFALIVSFVFEFVRVCGELVDISRGVTIANVLDPLTSQHASPLAGFFYYAFLALFISVGGAGMVLESLVSTYAWIPIGEGLPGRVTAMNGVEYILTIVSGLLIASVQLVTPIVVLLLLTDVALAFIGRFASRIQLFYLSAALKPLIATFLVLVISRVFLEGLLSMATEAVRNVLQ